MELADQLDEYKDIISGHPHFNTAYKRLRKMICHAVSDSIIFLFGPTGVGKSTLQKKLIKDVLIESSAETAVDRSLLPIVRIELPHSTGKEFSWVEFYRAALDALQEPLIDKKFKYLSARSEIDLKTHRLNSRPSSHELKVAFKDALLKRNTRIILLDEAHHFSKGFTGDELYVQLESIKSMSSLNPKTVFVLAGTYELLPFLNRSGQLSRRGFDVHFPRYKAENAEEKKQFIKILKAFKNNSPLNWDKEILKDIDYVYTHSAGCVGILKGWIDQALNEALTVEAESQMLTLDNFKTTELTIEKMKVIAEEIVGGEKSLEPKVGDLQALQEMLGVRVKSDLTQTADGYGPLLPEPSVIPRPKRRQVGIRNAKRDVIGMAKDEIT